MLYYTVKLVISALTVVAIGAIAKRSTAFAALVASLPLTSLLAFVWLYLEGTPPEKIADLSAQIFWLVMPSLLLFVLLPILLRHGFGFWVSFTASISATATAYLVLVSLLRYLGIEP